MTGNATSLQDEGLHIWRCWSRFFISLLYRLLNPGTQRIWESGQPWLLKSPPPGTQDYLKYSKSHLCCWTQCLLVSLLAQLIMGPEFLLGVSREKSPLWGVFALLHRSIIPLETYTTESQMSPVVVFKCFWVTIKSHFHLCSPSVNPVTSSLISFFLVTCCSGESLEDNIYYHNCPIVSLPLTLTARN